MEDWEDIDEFPAARLEVGDEVVARDGAVLKVVMVKLTGAKTMRVGFDRYGSLPAFETKLQRRAIVRVRKRAARHAGSR